MDLNYMEFSDFDDIAEPSDDMDSLRGLLFGMAAASSQPRWAGRIMTHFEADDEDDEVAEIREIEEVAPALNRVEERPKGLPARQIDFKTEMARLSEREVAAGTSAAEVSQFLINLGLRIQARYLADQDGLVG